MTLAGTVLVGCSVLWLRARHARVGIDALTLALAVITALQIALLPLQYGVFFAGRKARALERVPEGLVGLAPPVWLVDRGANNVVLLGRDAGGRSRIIPLKAEKLDGIGVIRTCTLGKIVEPGGCP